MKYFFKYRNSCSNLYYYDVRDNHPADGAIQAMATDEVLLYKNSALPTEPNAANMGTATQIEASSVIDFDGDDVILISSTNDVTCYANREDIIGDVPRSGWSSNEACYIRGGDYESPEADFIISHWIFLSVQTEVNVANSNTNIWWINEFLIYSCMHYFSEST